MKLIVIALFALTYVLMLSIPSRRHYIALTVAVIYIAMGVVAPADAFWAVDWNIIMMLFGTMGTVFLFIESKMPNKISDIMINKIKSVKLVFIAMALFAVVDNLVKDGINTWVPAILTEKYSMKDELSILSTIVLPILGTIGTTISVELNKYIKNFVFDCFAVRSEIASLLEVRP